MSEAEWVFVERKVVERRSSNLFCGMHAVECIHWIAYVVRTLERMHCELYCGTCSVERIWAYTLQGMQWNALIGMHIVE